MADFPFKFKPKDIYNDTPSRVARNAVLWPIAGPGPVIAAYASLQRQWRFRLMALQRAGYAALAPLREDETGLAVQYARNCPPFSVKRSWPVVAEACKRSRVCPNCYARRIVLETWYACRLALDLVAARTGQPLDDLKIVGVRWEVTKPPQEWQHWQRVARAARTKIIEGAAQQTSVYGAVTHLIMSPRPEPGLVDIIRYGVLIVPKSAGTIGIEEAVVKTVSAGAPTGEIARLFSWALRYPVGLMRGDAGRGAWLLNNLAGSKLKLSVYRGLCDNRNLRQALQTVTGNRES